MIIICFKDSETERKAIGDLVGRSSGKRYANADTLVAEDALPHLVLEGIGCVVLGPATFEQLASLRNPAAVAV